MRCPISGSHTDRVRHRHCRLGHRCRGSGFRLRHPARGSCRHRIDADPWRAFVERACERVDGGSLGAAVDAAAKRAELSGSDRTELAFYLATEIEDEYAAGADQLSATTFDTGVYADGAQAVVTNGYDALPKLLAAGLQVVFNTPVTAITRRDDSVIVHAGNQSFEGPAAIVTVPLGVLKAGSIAFDPPIPEGHTRAVSALGFGALSKSFFRFNRRTSRSPGRSRPTRWV